MSFRPIVLRLYRSLRDRKNRLHAAIIRSILEAPTLEIQFPVFIEPITGLHVGDSVVINAFVHIWAHEPVRIGDNTMIASHVQITTSTHDYTVRPYRDCRKSAPVTIGRNVWIGTGAIILPGITIGDNAVIGAGSVVSKDVPENTVVAGVPARVIRTL
jgi:acetyltransferase-like isoleucine patch superfamily enzyme